MTALNCRSMSQINKLRAEANAPKRSKCLNYSAPQRAVCVSARNALLQIRLAAKECNQIVSLLLSGRTLKAIDPLGPRADVFFFFANRRSELSAAEGPRHRRTLRKKPGLIQCQRPFPWGQGSLERIVPDSMKSAEPWRYYFASKGRPRNPNRRPSSPFATTWWAGPARSAFSRRCAGGQRRAAAIGSLFL